MSTYETIVKVCENDLDELNHVNNIRYLEWVQEVAKAHWFHNVSPEIRSRYFWVVLSHHIEYKSAALLDDSITIKTYITKFESVTSKRNVEMYNTDTKKLINKTETNWCLLDTNSKRPTRITKEIISLFD